MAVFHRASLGGPVGHYNSFIVRLWSDDNGRLHGTVEHVATRRNLVFLDLDAVTAFIRARISLAPEEIIEERMRALGEPPKPSLSEGEESKDA